MYSRTIASAFALLYQAHSIQAALSDLGCTGGSSLFVIPGPITVELSTWYPIDVQKCPTGTKPASLHGGIIPEAAATVKACRAITGSDLVWGDSGTTEGGTAWKLSDTEPATLLYGFNQLPDVRLPQLCQNDPPVDCEIRSYYLSTACTAYCSDSASPGTDELGYATFHPSDYTVASGGGKPCPHWEYTVPCTKTKRKMTLDDIQGSRFPSPKDGLNCKTEHNDNCVMRRTADRFYRWWTEPSSVGVSGNVVRIWDHTAFDSIILSTANGAPIDLLKVFIGYSDRRQKVSAMSEDYHGVRVTKEFVGPSRKDSGAYANVDFRNIQYAKFEATTWSFLDHFEYCDVHQVSPPPYIPAK